MLENNVFLIPLVGVLALLFAIILRGKVFSVKVTNEKVKEIASYIQEGSMAFLKKEYKTLIPFSIILCVLVSIGVNIQTGIAFIVGVIFSGAAGFIGMRAATNANSRTAVSAEQGGLSKALSVAFSGGAIMGMSVVGLGLIGISGLYIIFDDPSYLTGFSLGASTIALFSRVGGGIYTKAADVGADLVGKVEAGIPEDDPRNPAVIADNVGDNVGDTAGMGADLFESYVGSLVAAMALGLALYDINGVLFTLFLAASGVIASIIGSLFVRGKEGKDPHKSLKTGTYVSGAIVSIAALVLSNSMFGNINAFIAIISGLIVGILIGHFTEIYTSADYKSVKNIAKQSETGEATNILSGISVGMKSTFVPIILICIGIFVSYKFNGLYGIALSAVGMLSTAGMTVAVDAYGPIADNAGGIAEMSKLDGSVREITDKLDSVGNTTAAIGKGFAIGSAALTALALFTSFAEVAQISSINVLNPKVVIGLLFGGSLPFLFSALTIDSVSKAAFAMIEEVRRQFKEIPGIMEGTGKPDYATCVEISTKSALREMLIPGVLAVTAPLAVGFIFGTEALGGLLAGSLVTGILLAIFMSNAGGSWDNAKKYIEEGNNGGKGSDSHKAAVVGDTVGDPFKDTSGPSLNILIKLMTIVSLVFAPLMVELGSLLK